MVELQALYYRITDGEICYRAKGVDQCQPYQTYPFPFARTFNPFKIPVNIYGTNLYVSDTKSFGGKAFYALQRNSDYALIRVSFLQFGSAGGAENIPGGGYIFLHPQDHLLEENGVIPGAHRSLGVTIFYTPA